MPDDRIETDTIVACSTAPGLGAIAVVRISGPEAWSMVRSLCPDLSRTPPRVVRLTTVKDPESGQLVDRALVTHFAAPASYTGEDMAELSCHGGWLSPALVEEAAVRLGCRRAEPGEFTRRAYLNGKVDLVQAEAVMDVVEGRSAALRRAALDQLESGLSGRLEDLRQGIVRLEAFLVQHIDFPEEDEAPLAVDVVADEAEAVVRRLEALLATAPEGELLREGAVTVLAGRPNAGKSSLFNALVGQDRAIVTPEPGTTRDAIEAVVSMGGYPFRLVDTAGIRETDGQVERLGVEVSRRYLERADVILLCVESGTSAGRLEEDFLGDLNGVPVVLVRTKSDVSPGPTPDQDPTGTELTRRGDASHCVGVSARTGEGLRELRHLLPSLVFRGLVETTAEVPVLTRRRHADGLGTAADEVRRFAGGLRAGLPAEVAATHLRTAETALEEVLGVISKDDVLDLVFRDFCIGK